MSALHERLALERYDIAAKAARAGSYLALVAEQEYCFRHITQGLTPTILICGIEMWHELEMEILHTVAAQRWMDLGKPIEQQSGYPFAVKLAQGTRCIMCYRHLWIVGTVSSENSIVFL